MSFTPAISGGRNFPSEPFSPFSSAQPGLQAGLGSGVYSTTGLPDPKKPRVAGTQASGFNTSNSNARRIGLKIEVQCLDRNEADDPTMSISRGMVLYVDINPIVHQGFRGSAYHVGGRFMGANLGIETRGLTHVSLTYYLHQEAINSPNPPTVDEAFRRYSAIGVVSSDKTEATYKTSVRALAVDAVNYYAELSNNLSPNVRPMDHVYALYVPVPLDKPSTYNLNPNTRAFQTIDAKAGKCPSSVAPPYRVAIQYAVSEHHRFNPQKLQFKIPTGRDVHCIVQGHAVRIALIKDVVGINSRSQVRLPAPCALEDANAMKYKNSWVNATAYGACQLINVVVAR